MSKKICKHCGQIVDENHSCEKLEEKKEKYNKYKRDYYKKNKETLKSLTTVRWRKLRKHIISRDNNMCLRCSIKYGIINGDDLQVHHIKPRILFPELIYDENNLVTLCKTCNIQLGLSGIDFEWKPEITESFLL